MTAQHLCLEASRRGLRLEPRGDKLAVIPAHLCPPDFADELRAHKRELLNLLETRTACLPPDCAPWLHIARQILAEEFDGADRSTVESLTIGVRNIPHPLCRRALEHLKASNRAMHPPR